MPEQAATITEHLRIDSLPRAWRLYAAAFAAALVLYLASMAPGVLWQDSGLAQVRTIRRDLYGDLGLALSHPLYYVFTIAFQALPFRESAFKTNLVSAVFGAVTVANVFLLLRLLSGGLRGAAVGAISVAVAHTFWQHCALAEVYTVTTALLTAELLCFLQYVRTGRDRWLPAMFLFNGLGISNHMFAVLSLVCWVVFVVWRLGTKRLRPCVLPLLLLAWACGAGLYLSMIGVEIARGAGVGETLRSAIFGRSYMRNVMNLLPSRRQIVHSVLYLGLSFPTPVVLLVLPALASLRTGTFRPVRVAIAALLAVHLVFAVRYDVPDQYTFFIPSLVLIGILIGLGADRFLRGRSAGWTACLVVGALLPAAVYAPLPRVARAFHLPLGVSRGVPYRDEYAYFLHPWKTGYEGAWRFANEVREVLPGGAVLIADSTTVRPIQYLQLTGRWPRDVTVWPPMPEPGQPIRALTEQDLHVALSAGKVYVVSTEPGYCPAWLRDGYEFCRYGIVYRVCGRRPAAVP